MKRKDLIIDEYPKDILKGLKKVFKKYLDEDLVRLGIKEWEVNNYEVRKNI